MGIFDFFKSFPQKDFTDREIFMKPNETIPFVYYIKEGTVRMFTFSTNGEEINLNLFRKESFIPMMFLLGDAKNKYYFQAIGTVKTYKAPVEKVLEFIKGNNDVLLDLSSRFSFAISGLLERIENLVSDDAKIKIIKLLVYLATKFGEVKKDVVVITLPLRHEDIANWLGLTRETVSRQMESLQKSKLVKTVHKQIHIFDVEKLKSLSKSS
jgi:CRP/FNR family transcriptional regulator